MNKKKNSIALLLPSLAAGGAEHFITRLAIELKQKGYNISLFLIDGVVDDVGDLMLDRLRANGIYVSLPSSFLFINNVFRLIYFIHEIKPFVLLSSGYKADAYAILTRLFDPLNHLIYISRLTSTKQLQEFYSKIIFKIRYFSFHHIVVCSSSIYNTLPLVFKKKMTIIPNGVSMPIMDSGPWKDNLRYKHNLNESDFIFINVGSFRSEWEGGGLATSQKAYDVILKAFALSFKGNAGIKIILLGDGELKKTAILLTEQLGIEKQVLFVGLQRRPDQYIRISNVFFFPSRFEGMPNVLLEAASLGIPVIASNIHEVKNIALSSWLLAPIDDLEMFKKLLLNAYKNYSQLKIDAEAAVHSVLKERSILISAERYLELFHRLRI